MTPPPSYTPEQLAELEQLIRERYAPLAFLAKHFEMSESDLAHRMARKALSKGPGRVRSDVDLVPLIERHAGCLAAIGRELGVSRQAVAFMLRRRGLEEDATRLRTESKQPTT